MEAAASGVMRVALPRSNRSLPAVRALCAELEKGWLGELRSIDIALRCEGPLASARAEVLELVLLVLPGARLEHTASGRDEDTVLVFRRERATGTARISVAGWAPELRVEVVGIDGYALLDAPDGGERATLRLGKRWAWTDGTGRTQRETEDVRHFGDRADSAPHDAVR